MTRGQLDAPVAPSGSRTAARPSLVVLRALGLGDLLTAVPALRALADAFPRHHRVLAAPAWLAELALLSGAVDEVVDTAPLAPLDPSLHDAAIAVNLHGRGPQSHGVLLASRPRRLIAFANDEVPETAGFPEWRSREHEVHRWCRMLQETGIPADPSRLDLPVPDRPVPEWARGATLIHPGSKDPAKRWPVERWGEVARHEVERGRAVTVTGSADEVDLAATVARLAGLAPDNVFAGRTDVLDLAALVAAADRVASGDTGAAHLATALRTPSVILFGPVSPMEWGPPPGRPGHRVLWKKSSAGTGRKSPEGGLLGLTVDKVLAALDSLPPATHRTSVSALPA